VGLLAAHLTPENHRELLDIARHKSKRQVEELVARLLPQPPVSSSVRKLPTASHIPASPMAQPDAAASPQPTGDGQGVASVDLLTGASALPRPRPAVVTPLAPERYKEQFTANAETDEKLRLAQALLRHQIPDGDPAKIIDRALTVLLRDLAKTKLAATDHPRKRGEATRGSRYIPAEVKRAVWGRDGAQCAFVSSDGRRCTERGFLEFHHVTPYAAGGEPTAENIQLRCRPHNGYEAELAFGLRHRLIVREARASYMQPPRKLRPPSRLAIRRQLGPDRVRSRPQLGPQVERYLGVPRYSGEKLSASTSTRCFARRPVPWAICWRQETPIATISVSVEARRTAGNSLRSAIASEMS